MTQREKDVKQYLERYEKQLDKIDDIKELYERLYTQATGTGAKLDAAGYIGSGFSGNIVENSAIMLESTEEKIKAQIIKSRKMKATREKLIDGYAPDEITKMILKKSYIECKDPALIAREIGKSISTVYKKKRTGIEHIAKRVKIIKPS